MTAFSLEAALTDDARGNDPTVGLSSAMKAVNGGGIWPEL